MEDIVDFFIVVGAWSLVVLAWIVALILAILFGTLLVVWIAAHDPYNAWHVENFFALFHLLWMVPVVVVVGGFAAWLTGRTLDY